MNRTIEVHEPSPEFRAHLEWEIQRSLRREALRPQPRPAVGWSKIRSAAVIALAVAVGFGGSVVSAQIQEGWQRQQLLEAEESELRLATLRAAIAREQLEAARRRTEVGVAGRETLLAAEAEVAAMDQAVARIRLNLSEIRATARPPRDDLAAPTANDRDFVSERLELAIPAAQSRLTAAESEVALAERRSSMGVGSEIQVLETQADLARARAEFERLVGMRELRRRFLDQSVPPLELTRRLRLLELTRELQTSEQLHRLAEARLALLRRRFEAGGGVQQVELLRAELAVSELEAEVEAIRRNRETVQRPDF